MKLYDPRSWALRKSVDFDTDDTGQNTENCDRQSLNKSFWRDLSTNIATLLLWKCSCFKTESSKKKMAIRGKLLLCHLMLLEEKKTTEKKKQTN